MHAPAGYFARRINAECRAAGSAQAAQGANLLLFALAESTGLPSADSSAAAVAVALLEKYQRVRWVEKTFSLTWEKGEKAEGDGFSIREERKTVAKLEGSSLQNALRAALDSAAAAAAAAAAAPAGGGGLHED